MKKPKYHLKYLEVNFRDEHREHTKEIISFIAEGTGALEALRLECGPCPPGAFSSSVENNKSLMLLI